MRCGQPGQAKLVFLYIHHTHRKGEAAFSLERFWTDSGKPIISRVYDLIIFKIVTALHICLSEVIVAPRYSYSPLQPRKGHRNRVSCILQTFNISFTISAFDLKLECSIAVYVHEVMKKVLYL
jgi:hypothetical protein